MKIQTPHQELEALGIGIFVRNRYGESRLTEKDFHRAFSEPVIIWFEPRDCDEEKMVQVLARAKKLHAVTLFRFFPRTVVSQHLVDLIRNEFPKAGIEGVQQ